MDKPYRFCAIHKKTKEIREFNFPGLAPNKEWEATGTPGESKEVYNWDVFEDTRYKAKLRLYNYEMFGRFGLEAPRYQPYKNTEIGKTIPILNF